MSTCRKTLSVQINLKPLLGCDTFIVMTVKFLISSVMLLCFFSQTLAQVSGNLEWQDTETFLQQGTLAAGETICSVDLPLIGNVKALEQTPASFARLLEVLYDKDYLQNPKISVNFTDGTASSKPTERSFDPAFEQRIDDVSNYTPEDVALGDLTLESLISPDSSSSNIENLHANAPLNELTASIDNQSIVEPFRRHTLVARE